MLLIWLYVRLRRLLHATHPTAHRSISRGFGMCVFAKIPTFFRDNWRYEGTKARLAIKAALKHCTASDEWNAPVPSPSHFLRNFILFSGGAMFVVIFVFALMSIFYYEYNFYTNENFDILSVDDKAESVRDPSNSIANRMRSFSLGHHDEEYAWEVESRLDDHTADERF
ncbi:hypothetical protein V3C99_017859 [Haemonchus contortus]